MNDTPHAGRRGGIPGWISSHPKTTAALLLLLLLILGTWMLESLARKRLQRRLDAIRAAGEPLTVDDLNAAMPSIPDEENMARLAYEYAERMYAFRMSEEQEDLLPALGRAKPTPTGQRLPAEQLAVMRAYLEEVSEDLAGLHAALELEQGCFGITWGIPPMLTAMPELTQFWHVVKVLALEAMVAADDGDGERAGRILDEMFHFDRAQRCNTTLIATLVRVACCAVTYDQVERTINLCGQNEDALRRLQAKLLENEGAFALRPAMMTERVLVLDTMQWLQDEGTIGSLTSGSAEAAAGRWFRLIPLISVLNEVKSLEILTELVRAIDQPDAAALEGARAAGAKAAALPGYCFYARMLLPSLTRAVELWVRTIGSNRALRAALACERFRLATGDWPETLGDLVPVYLDAVPLDPFDEAPIRYARIEEGIKLWSIGEDMTDDGGDVRRLKRSGNARPTDFGWVLLNPDLRGRPAEDDEDD